MHNSFDIEVTDNLYTAKSHNYPGITGTGDSEQAAIYMLDRNIRWIKNNDKVRWMESINKRKKMKLQCLCGLPMPKGETPKSFYG